jgi:hypothetical protein
MQSALCGGPLGKTTTTSEPGSRHSVTHAVQDVLEALAFPADAVGTRDDQFIDEHLVRVDALAAHFLDFAQAQAMNVCLRVALQVSESPCPR